MGATMLTLHCGLRLKTAAIGLGILLAMTPMAAAKTVINVMLNTQTPQATELMTKELIPAFEKAYPDISVQFSTLDWNTRDQKLRVLYAGGVAPDVIEIGSDTIIGDVANGFPLALDNRINSWAGRADLIPETWQPSKWNGHQYGVPYTLTGRELFYLTSVFDEAGLNSAKAPRSWEDLKDYTRKLTITSGDGTMKRLGFAWGWPEPQSFYWYLWQNKAEVVNEVTGTALFNTKEGIETLNFLTDIFQMQGAPKSVPNFFNRSIGIRYNSTHAAANEVRTKAPELYDELRMFTVDRKGSSVWPLYVNSLAISSQSKNPDAAWAFITWFSKIENVMPYISNVGLLSPNRKALGTEYIQRTMKPVQGVYTETNNARPNFQFAGIMQVRPAMVNALTKVINKQISPEEGLSQMEFEWNNIRDQYYKK